MPFIFVYQRGHIIDETGIRNVPTKTVYLFEAMKRSIDDHKQVDFFNIA